MSPGELNLPSARDGPGGDDAGPLENPTLGRDHGWSPAIPLIAGAAPGQLEILRNAAAKLGGIVRQWRVPDKATLPTTKSAERLLGEIYGILEDWVVLQEKLSNVYRGFRREIRQDYQRAMKAIRTFQKVLIAEKKRSARRTPRQEKTDSDAFAAAWGDLFEAVGDFQERMEVLMIELERASKEP